MKRARLIFLSVLIGTISWVYFSKQFIQPDFVSVRYASSIESNRQYLGSSMQILIYPDESDQHERGLGTLTWMGGEKVILTHNHWDYLDDVQRSLIVNADDQLLLELTGRQFKDLIRHRDRGTLILKAPDGLKLKPAHLSQGQDLQVGDIIEVVKCNPDDRYQAEVVSAEITSIDEYHNLPVIRFRLLGGNTIRRGDSGGSVWLQGRLLGNTWGMYMEEESAFWSGNKEVQTSIAALLPQNYLAALSEIEFLGKSNQPGEIDLLAKIDP
jgi:hypothetical protein